MHKQLVLIIFLIVATLSFTACQTTEPTSAPASIAGLAPAEPLQIYPELENNVSMVATNLRSSSLTVIIQNDSDFPLFTSWHYILEVYDNGQWRCMLPMMDIYISDILEGILPHESLRFPMDLSFIFPLEAGFYRIRKDVMIDTWQTDELIDEYPRRFSIDTRHEVVAEFQWGG